LKAPFPWFGGKSRCASLVWERFGNVEHYIEPFFGSGAVLLNRPHLPKLETVNDLDCFVANLWRALAHDPEAVAQYAQWPVNEADLNARHRWLIAQDEFRTRMLADPDYFDAKIAGWWVWGQSIYIGGGWCGRVRERKPNVTGRGVARYSLRDKRRPHLSHSGTGLVRRSLSDKNRLLEYFHALQARLRYVRVCSGDWQRVCTPAVLAAGSPAGVFLDPPYSRKAGRDPEIYAADNLDVACQVRDWAVAHGDDPKLRIAVCGYEGEHEFPESWECVHWWAHGGYSNRSDGVGRRNARRERIWFSPHCLRPTLF
jgi:hypothetical protein